MIDKLSVNTKRGSIQSIKLITSASVGKANLSYSLTDLNADEKAFIGPDGNYSVVEYRIDIQQNDEGIVDLDPKSFFELSDLESHFKIELFEQDTIISVWEATWPDRAGDGAFEIELEKPKKIPEPKPEPETKPEPPKSRVSPVLVAMIAIVAVVAVLVIYQNKDSLRSAKLDCFEPEVVMQAANNDDLKVQFRNKCITELGQLDEQGYNDLLASWISADMEMLEIIGDFYNPYISDDLLDGLKPDVGDMASSTAATYYLQASQAGLQNASSKLRSLCERVEDDTERFFMQEQCRSFD